MLGRRFEVDATWPHRLVRAEVDLDAGRIRFYALRRREPDPPTAAARGGVQAASQEVPGVTGRCCHLPSNLVPTDRELLGLGPGSMATWTPGRDPIPLPDGISMPWKPGADFVLQLHLHPSGKPEVGTPASGST